MDEHREQAHRVKGGEEVERRVEAEDGDRVVAAPL